MSEDKKDQPRSTSKKHKLLQDVDQQLQGQELFESVDILGHVYKLVPLGAQEENFARSFLDGNSPASFVASQRLPRVAASLRSIDGVDIDELFSPDEESLTAKLQEIFGSQYAKRQWQLAQILDWLRPKPHSMIDELWEAYGKLNDRRKESLDSIKKSLTGIPSGELKPSSSPEKESSSVAQTS